MTVSEFFCNHRDEGEESVSPILGHAVALSHQISHTTHNNKVKASLKQHNQKPTQY
eukprot:m.67461 g.67461  ORF g.67461 m.67461 type:complete len:56 (+) comp49969_c0_seq2:805-972(+)